MVSLKEPFAREGGELLIGAFSREQSKITEFDADVNTSISISTRAGPC
jgi:hypothetical protein